MFFQLLSLQKQLLDFFKREDPVPKLAHFVCRGKHLSINFKECFPSNPPEPEIAQKQIKRVKNGKFIMLPASEQTFGHGKHTHAEAWQPYLKELLEKSQR